MLDPVELPVSLCAQWSSDFLLNSQRIYLLLESSPVWHSYTLLIYPKYLHFGNHLKHSLTLILQEHVVDAHQLA